MSAIFSFSNFFTLTVQFRPEAFNLNVIVRDALYSKGLILAEFQKKVVLNLKISFLHLVSLNQQ